MNFVVHAIARRSAAARNPTFPSQHSIMANYGLLVPTGGGEDVPLKKDRILIGRRDNCDIVLRFPNVSGQHCQLTLETGYWFAKDLDSRNGTKVNGFRIAGRKRLDPGCILSIAKHQYKIHYNPDALGASGSLPMDDDSIENMMRSSLMDRAGLDRRSPENDGANKNELEE
ncbi:MAG: FHA domain-containing protein [Pirellulaceae bacterium]|nr:FHA domain-containing protein [Pirellulaceae bacterium]